MGKWDSSSVQCGMLRKRFQRYTCFLYSILVYTVQIKNIDKVDDLKVHMVILKWNYLSGFVTHDEFHHLEGRSRRLWSLTSSLTTHQVDGQHAQHENKSHKKGGRNGLFISIITKCNGYLRTLCLVMLTESGIFQILNNTFIF